MSNNPHARASKILASWKILEEDHEPDGWPGVRMRELTEIQQYISGQDKDICELRDLLSSCARYAGKSVSPLCSIEHLARIPELVEAAIKRDEQEKQA